MLRGLDEQQVARRVEELRGLDYDPIPKLRIVTSEQAAGYVTRQSGRAGNVKEDEEVLKLLGLLEPDTSLDEVAGTLGGEAVLGYYKGRPPTVALVAGAAADDPKAAEGVLAHELLHGLDDQRFQIFDSVKRMTDGPSDRIAAFSALVEGDAGVLEDAYAEEYDTDSTASIGGEEAEEAIEELPFALLVQAAFVYEDGKSFVEFLMERGDGYELVNRAFAERPPISTAQVLDPEKYIRDVRPEPVAVSPGTTLGRDWTRRDSTTLGQLEVLQLLAFDAGQLGEYGDAAEGWAGGRMEFWRRGAFDPRVCPAPCRERDVVVIRIRWEETGDAEEMEEALGDSLEENQDAKPADEGAFVVNGGGVAVSSWGRATTIAWAPSPELARRLAGRAG